jgi:hypothetical protein
VTSLFKGFRLTKKQIMSTFFSVFHNINGMKI